jgi:hypothetical protein
MKRSEMKEKLGREIELWKDSGSRGGLLDLILDKCEEYGMQPPQVEEESYVINKQGRMVDVTRRWEPEDET